MSAVCRLGVVILAAGSSSRFGGNKLLAHFRGRPVIEHALELASACGAVRMAVVAADPDLITLVRSRGIEVIVNDAPSLGQAHSIVLGVSAMEDMEAVLLMAADQPLLTRESMMQLISRYALSEKGLACLSDATHFGNPAVFSRAYFGALKQLKGDRGAKPLLKQHGHDLLIVRCAGDMELFDVDTKEALKTLESR